MVIGASDVLRPNYRHDHENGSACDDNDSHKQLMTARTTVL